MISTVNLYLLKTFPSHLRLLLIMILGIFISELPAEQTCCKISLSNALSPRLQRTTYQYELAMASIFRNEASYLKEWIEFHLLVGFEHFYLFNNLSADDYLSVLQPYIDNGIVDLIEWPYESTNVQEWNGIQCNAYMEAVKRSKGIAKWVAFLDTDEFIFPVEQDNLADLLVDYEQYGCLCANWVIYGTSYVSKIPEGELLIQRLTHRAALEDRVNFHVKSIVRPECVAGCYNPHFLGLRAHFSQINTDKVRFFGAFSPYVQINAVRINHYTYRDENFLFSQKIPRLEKWSGGPVDPKGLMDNYNKVFDDAIFRFIPCLKERMDLVYSH